MHEDADATHALARAVFTEPAYWTPELPNLYRLEARLVCGDRAGTEIDRLIGLRRLGVRGRSLWLEGRRWVPRGVTVAAAGFDAAELRSLSAAAIIDDPPAVTRGAADAAGVAIIGWLADTAGMPLRREDAVARIAAWSLHPSVVLAVVPRTATAELAATVVAAALPLKGTMLIGLEVDGTRPPAALPATLVAAVDCLVVTLPVGGTPHEDWRSAAPWPASTPLVARRPLATAGDLPERRRECDLLQATLAAWGLAGGLSRQPWDWAGYLV